MRRALLALTIALVGAVALPNVVQAQSRDTQRDMDDQARREAERGPAPLRRRANAGPCPFVKILYDGARYVELADGRATASNVGFTGEIEGLRSDCTYRDDQPITVDMNLLFNLGRGPRADGDARNYRYWIAVTERNRAILSKEYFDLPVAFEGSDRATTTAEHTIVIPRASATTSGDNFEVLVGFDVTPEMAEFNRSGSRFRIQAGTQN
jgi:hypothetical protein